MAVAPTLDLDLLRTLMCIAEDGSFTRAARRVGRTQSTVSLQMQRLEELIGHSVLLRGKGGVVEFTPRGKLLLESAKNMLALNDQILGSLKSQPLHGSIRLGTPQDYSQLYLQAVISSFAKAYPDVSVEIQVGSSCELVPLLRSGKIDVMLCEGGHEPPQWPSVELWRAPLRWITSTRSTAHLQDPLPVSLSPGNCPFRPAWLSECVWRGAVLRALDGAGRRYQIVSTSTSVVGQQAAVLAGIAVTVSTVAGLNPGLKVVDNSVGLPDLPDTTVLLLKSQEARQPLADALCEHIEAMFKLAMDEVTDALTA